MAIPAIFNWSTGKDSALALHTVLRDGAYDVRWLLTTVNEHYDRVSMHGVRTTLLRAQAAAIGIPLIEVRLPETPTMEHYDRIMMETLSALRAEGAEASIFGDIFLEDLRAYRESRLAEAGLRGHFPLWKRPTDALVYEVIELGFTATTTCVNAAVLDHRFVGRVLDDAFVRELPAGVDPCGENGEFHTFVSAGPLFTQPVPVRLGDVIRRPSGSGTGANPGTDNAGFWYCDLLSADDATD